MSCGKSTLGKMLSKHLDLTFVDIDSQIELFCKQTISELFLKGEENFRFHENQALIKTIENYESAVIACGGGTPCFHNNIEIIKNSGKSFYLKTKPETIYHRLTKTRNQRPLFKNLPQNLWLDKIYELLEIREPFYKQAHYIIDGENNALERILQCLQYDADFKKKVF
jgi:shikimate kinase